jgi:hypothetical protein
MPSKSRPQRKEISNHTSQWGRTGNMFGFEGLTLGQRPSPVKKKKKKKKASAKKISQGHSGYWKEM